MGQPSAASGPPLAGGCQVRCAGCHWILTVAAGMTEFSCPKCQLPQMLPPEMMRVQAQGIDPTKIQLPCIRCKAILNVPHGLARFSCPQCGVELAVDISKLPHHYPPPSINPPEEVNEVRSSSSYNSSLSLSLSFSDHMSCHKKSSIQCLIYALVDPNCWKYTLAS